VKRVPVSELDYPGEDGLYYHGGEPFTGVAFDRAGRGLRTEAEYRGGLSWGTVRIWHPSGAPASEKQTVAGVFHGLCQEWDDQGQLIRYEVYELGVCVWRRRWESGALVEDWRLSESDGDFATLQMLRKHSLHGLAELGGQDAE
jgi:hypothetical protein